MSYLLEQPSTGGFPPYIFYKAALDPATCERIIGLHKGYPMHDARIGDGSNEGTLDPKIRQTQVAWMPWDAGTGFIYDKLSVICDDVRRNWYPFSLSGFPEPLQLTRYRASEGGHYQSHRDMGCGRNATRKLSMTCQLSPDDAYEGGDFEIFSSDGTLMRVPEQSQGTVLCFPAWEMHRVLPVTKHERWSLVAWVHGPAFT